MSKKLFWFLLVPGIIVFVGGPLIVQYNNWTFWPKVHGDWLGFWGSYLGVIPSGLIAYAVARYQIEQDRIFSQKKQMEDKLEFRKREILTESKNIFLENKKMTLIYRELENAWTAKESDSNNSDQNSAFLAYFVKHYFKVLNDDIEKLKYDVDAFDILYRDELKNYGVSVEIISRILDDIIKLSNNLNALYFIKDFKDGKYDKVGLIISRTGIGQITVGKIDDYNVRKLILNTFFIYKELANHIEFLFNNIKNNIDKDMDESA